MFRRFIVLVLLGLAACTAPAAAPPTATPRPTSFNLPTLAPVGATILPSDIGTPAPTGAATAAALQSTPLPTAPPVPTPVAFSFDFALRPAFRNELNKVENKTFYAIQWQFSDDLSELKGSQRVSYANQTGQPLREIYFRLFANISGTHDQIHIDSLMVGRSALTPTFQAQNTVMRVPLDAPLAPGRIVVVQIEYTVKIPADSPAHYSDFTRTNWITTLPTVYPLIPAYDDKGWHLEVPPDYGDLVYAESSVFDVTITTPSNYTAITSGQLVQETPLGGGHTTRRFIGAPMRDFDVNLSNTLEKSSAQVGDITINSWYRPEDAESGKRALQWTVDALGVYEKHFGPYPFGELDLVETPTTAGGIEYPGLITVASNLYSDPGQSNFFEFATVHETAHQWWYSVVGNDQVNHPWQDEALVQYSSLVYFEDRYGKATAQTISQTAFDRTYEQAKAKYGDRPAGLAVSAYDENAYGAFVYGKGPKFFQAVRAQIGDDAFFKALQTYYQTFKYRVAQPQDLVNAFQQASGQDIKPLFDKWIGG